MWLYRGLISTVLIDKDILKMLPFKTETEEKTKTKIG